MKTEKEKMLGELPYNASDKELVNGRLQAKQLLFDFNQLRPKEIKQRKNILKQLLGKTGLHFYIEPPFRCDYGVNISMGENFYANYNLVILDCAEVTIGDNVLIGPNVSLFTAAHPIHHKKREGDLEFSFPITIADNVWIGGNTVLNPGVTIGENTVIGSGSVVTKSIPANVVAAGNPCKIIRAITDEEAACTRRAQSEL